MASVAPDGQSRCRGRAPRAPKQPVPEAKLMTDEERDLARQKREEKIQKAYDGKRAAVEASKTGLEAADADADSKPTVWSYVTVGGAVCKSNPLDTIHAYLASNRDYIGVSWQQFKRDLNIDLTDPRNAMLLRSLSSNPEISVTKDASGGPIVARRHELGITNAASLHHLFNYRLKDGLPMPGSKLARFCVTEKELNGSFPGVEVELDDMVSSGMVARIISNKAARSAQKEAVYFPAPPGVQAPSDLRNMWDETNVPRDFELEKYLLDRGLRTPAEYEERRKRDADRRKAEKELSQLALQEAAEANKDAKLQQKMQKWRSDFKKGSECSRSAR